MKNLKIIFLVITVFLFTNTNQAQYSSVAEVISSGGGESASGMYSNFGVVGETFVDYCLTGGNYKTCLGFIYASSDFICVSVTEVPKEQSPIIYPNPTGGVLFIDNLDSQCSTIQIYNFYGSLMQNCKYTNEIDISFLARGMYALVLKDGRGNRIKAELFIVE